MRISRRWLFAVAFGILVAGGAIRYGSAQNADPSEPAPAPQPAPTATPVAPGPTGPQRVTVGVFLRNVESIDLQNNSYHLNFILWLKWRGPIDPTESFRFVNLIEASGLHIEAQYPEPIEVDSHRYQQFHIEGKFFHKFWLGTFPLDWQRVTLEVQDSRHSTDQLIYEPDTRDSGVSSFLRIPGWRIVEITNQRWDTTYNTDLGLGSQSPGRTRPGFRFGLRIERPMKFYFFKIIPPILVTLACCIMVFLLRPTYVDARVGTPIAALLTAVFLQLTFTGNLPSVGIMLLIDHIFNFSYLVIFTVLLMCMVSARMVDQIETLNGVIAEATDEDIVRKANDDIDALFAKMKRLDRRAVVIIPIAYIVGIITVTIIVRGSYLFEMMFD